MKTPPMNTGKEAVALRIAATAFGDNSRCKIEDDHDANGQRLNRALLKAAENYGAAVNVELLKQAHRCLWNREECFLGTSDRLLQAIRKIEPKWEPEDE